VIDRNNGGSPRALDLNALRADPAQVDQLNVEALVDVLGRCAEERDGLAVVERRVQSRLRHMLHETVSTRDDFPEDDDELVDDAQAGRFLKVPESHAADLRRRGEICEVLIGEKYKRMRAGDVRAYVRRARPVGTETRR
jgi:hypothetical protein